MKPSVAVAVLEEVAGGVVVIRVVGGEVIEVDDEVVLGVEEVVLGVEELLLLEDDITDDEDELLVGEALEDDELVMDKVDCEARLLYICKRSEPPQYSRAFPIHSIVHPVAMGTLPALSVFPQ